MLEDEAIRLREILLAQASASPLLNLGSSTAAPNVESALLGPLRAAGVEIVNCDLKRGPDVEVIGNLLDPAVRARLKTHGFRSVLVANVLEHVRDRAAAAAACEEIAGPGGLILATVPSSYPYHADPIDTYFRPSPAQLARCFPGTEPLLVEELAGPTYGEMIAMRGSAVWKEIAFTVGWAFLCPVRPKSFASRLHRWRWLRRPYRVSIALVRVRGD